MLSCTFFPIAVYFSKRVLNHQELCLGVRVVDVEVGGDDRDRKAREYDSTDGAQNANHVPEGDKGLQSKPKTPSLGKGGSFAPNHSCEGRGLVLVEWSQS